MRMMINVRMIYVREGGMRTYPHQNPPPLLSQVNSNYDHHHLDHSLDLRLADDALVEFGPILKDDFLIVLLFIVVEGGVWFLMIVKGRLGGLGVCLIFFC